MNLVLYLMALQISLALSVLWLGEGLRRDPPRGAGRITGLALIAALIALAASMGPLRGLFGHPAFLSFLGVMALLGAGWVAQCLMLPWLRRQAAGWLALVASPALYMTLLHLFLLRHSVLLLGDIFADRWAHRVFPAEGLSILMGLNLLAGAMLMAGAMAGLSGLGGFDRFLMEGGETRSLGLPERLALNFRRLLSLIMVRLMASGFSLAFCAHYDPLGPRYFFTSLLHQDVSMMVLRVLTGMILPALYALLGLGALRESRHAFNNWIFLPPLLLAVSGELIALSLTVGLWGIAF